MASIKDNADNALEVLRKTRQAATKLAEAAEGYLNLIESEPRPVVEVGEFYRTFDGSTVYIARKREGCTCPLCSGQVTPENGGPLALLFRMAPSLSAAADRTQAEVAAEHKEAVDETPTYVSLVIRGGHGVKEMMGERAGESVVVDGQGYVLLSKVDPKKDIATGDQLAASGLSLRKRLKVTMEEE